MYLKSLSIRLDQVELRISELENLSFEISQSHDNMKERRKGLGVQQRGEGREGRG